MGLKHGISQIGNTLSQLFNLCCNPFSENTWAHETFSARCGRLGHLRPYTYYKAAINAVFGLWDGPTHCEDAYRKLRDKVASHNPP